MMNTLTDEQAESARLAVANHLAKNPQEDEHRAAVEGLAFLRILPGSLRALGLALVSRD